MSHPCQAVVGGVARGVEQLDPIIGRQGLGVVARTTRDFAHVIKGGGPPGYVVARASQLICKEARSHQAATR